jgi:hypothetical protein
MTINITYTGIKNNKNIISIDNKDLIFTRNRAIIRILWGTFLKENDFQREKFHKEVLVSLKSEWNRKNIICFAVGDYMYKYLLDKGAEQVIKIDESIMYHNHHHLYAKPLIIREAFNIYKEILFLDWDILTLKEIDENLWNIIYGKKGNINGIFQCPMVTYRFGHLKYRNKEPKNEMLNTCCVYCSNKEFIDGWIDGFKYINYGVDETPLMYYVDKTFGKDMYMTRNEIEETFDIKIIKMRRKVDISDVNKKEENIYFWHR